MYNEHTSRNHTNAKNSTSNPTNDKIVFAKTLLTSLSSLNKFINAIDRTILDKAQFSFMNYGNTYNQISNICDIICGNNELRVLQKNIEELLARAPSKYEKIIYLHYRNELSIPKVAKTLGISERTAFRHLASATQWFAIRMDEVIHPVDFDYILSQNLWLRNIHKRVQ